MVFPIYTILLLGFIDNLFSVEIKNDNGRPAPSYFYEADNITKRIDFKCNYRKQMNLYRSSMSRSSTACVPGSIRRTRCVRPIAGDGNCLFRAISYLLHGTEEYYSSVRRGVVAYVIANWNHYEPYIVGVDTYPDVNCAAEYEKYMGADRVWGDEVEVNAASRFYEIRLHIYNGDGYFYCTGQEYSRTYALLHTIKSGHYRVVEDVFESCEPKKKRKLNTYYDLLFKKRGR